MKLKKLHDLIGKILLENPELADCQVDVDYQGNEDEWFAVKIGSQILFGGEESFIKKGTKKWVL